MDTSEASASSNGSPSTDLSAKYQKLASEYSKMRAQVIVLKKGVLDEQAKNNELRDELKEKDQRLRKIEQEVECLNFRNQQLTKRVSVLQDDLDQQQANSKRSKSKQNDRHHTSPSMADNESLSVLNTELQSKIQENETLHGKLQAAETDYGDIIEELRRELQELKCSSSAKQKEQTELIEQQREALNKLHQENVRLETRLATCQEELDKAKQLTQKFLGRTVSEADNGGDESGSSGGSDRIIVHLRSRVVELIDSVNAAESKSVLFHAECNRLKSRLQLSADEKAVCDRKIRELDESCRSLRDELATTVRNYESQLSTMSEHLAAQTEKWTAQQDEMESLKLMMNGNYNNGRKSRHK